MYAYVPVAGIDTGAVVAVYTYYSSAYLVNIATQSGVHAVNAETVCAGMHDPHDVVDNSSSVWRWFQIVTIS